MPQNTRYYFYSKASKICILFSLLAIPCFIILLIYSFHPLFLMGSLFLSFFIIFLNLYMFRNRLLITDCKIIYWGIKKYEFEKKQIESITLNKNKAISLKFKGKNYKIAGFFDFLCQTPNIKKNEELLVLLQKSLERRNKNGI